MSEIEDFPPLPDHLNKQNTVVLNGRSLHEVAEDVERILMEKNARIYQRAERLVRPLYLEVPGFPVEGQPRKIRTATFTEVKEMWLYRYMSFFCTFVKYSRHVQKWYISKPPIALAQIIMANSGAWPFPQVIGLLTCPTIRTDGSILQERGYDQKTGLLMMNAPKIECPAAPSREDAERGLAALLELIEEFPVTDESSKSVLISAMITPVISAALPNSPMHVIGAPTPGSGKSYLVDLCSAIVTGRPCPIIAVGRTEDETEKRLGAALLAGYPMLSIDNVNGNLGGDFLCQVVERPVTNVRLLGKSSIVQINKSIVLFATGNNIRLVGDITRRAVVADIDPKMERPEIRSFQKNPVEMVMNNRSFYIESILNIVRAYIVAGQPPVLSDEGHLASFEQWSALVRSALIWLDCADPVQTIKKSREGDPELGITKDLIAGMEEAFGLDNAVPCSKILNAAIGGLGQPSNETLNEAIASLKSKRGKADVVALGNWLRRFDGRVIGDRVIRSMSRGKRGNLWYIEAVSKEDRYIASSVAS